MVIQIRKDIEELVKLRIKPELKSKYGETEQFEGPMYDIITKLFKIVA